MKLLYNARIHTLDPMRADASTLVIQGQKILAAGGEDLLEQFDAAERQDMRGKVILPGLTDAHIHLQEYVISRDFVDCEVSSQAEIFARLAARLQEVPAGEWVRGHGWDQNTWGGAFPTGAGLDAIAPHHPVYLTAKSLHAAWANSAALRLAGITSVTPNPPDGRIQKDSRGEPTGMLFEDAMKLVEKVIPEPSADALAEKIHRLLPDLWRMGLTGIHDFDKRTCFQAFQVLHGRGELKLRVVKSIPRELLPHALEVGLRSGFGDDFLRIGSVKLFADGALGPHTGAMLAPYVDDPQNRGILVLDANAILDIGKKAALSGLSLAVHAIGDRAVREVLDGFTMLRAFESQEGLPHLRHRIEHVQTIDPRDAPRLAQLGLVASMQPIHAPSDMPTAERSLGRRSDHSYAWRTLLENGACLAFGSDAPVENPQPFHGLHAAVTRRRSDGSPGESGWIPAERLTFEQALRGFTTGPAFAAGMEDRLGMLAPGFLADLIVMDLDPFTADPADLYSMQPSAAMVGGEWVWQS